MCDLVLSNEFVMLCHARHVQLTNEPHPPTHIISPFFSKIQSSVTFFPVMAAKQFVLLCLAGLVCCAMSSVSDCIFTNSKGKTFVH